MLEVGFVAAGTYLIVCTKLNGNEHVHKALHLRLQIEVILKEIRGENQDWKTEVEILKKLHHPNLPKVLDFVKIEETYYIVMEYVQGKTLAQMQKQKKIFSDEQILLWMQDCLQAMEYLSKQQPSIIHGDIKPENMIINEAGRVILIDFNTSILGGQKNTIGYTREYAAPELFLKDAVPDIRSDIYSFGRSFLTMPVKKINSMRSRQIRKILKRAVSKNKRFRYQTIAQIYLDLPDSQAKKSKKQLYIYGGLFLMIGILIVGISSREIIKNALLLYEYQRYEQLAFQEIAKQSEFENQEREYETFEQYYETARNLYEQISIYPYDTKAWEALNMLARQVIEGGWLREENNYEK